MKFHLVTVAAALFAASVIALPAPQVNNHGLIPDSDDFVDGGSIEVVEARAAVNDNSELVDDDNIEVVEAIEVIQARTVTDTNDFADDDTIEAVETRDIDDTIEVVEAIEVIQARTVTDTNDFANDDTIEAVETRDVDDSAVDDTVEVVEARAVTANDATANFNFTSDFDFALDRLLAEIDEIPDDVLEKGDDALHQWLVEHGNRAGNEKLKRDDNSEAENLSLLERGELAARASLWKIAKCVAAIVQLLGTTAIPAAKLLRIKKYIKALGGTKKAVELLLKATTRAEKLKVGGQALVALAAELLGISTVKNNCF